MGVGVEAAVEAAVGRILGAAGVEAEGAEAAVGTILDPATGTILGARSEVAVGEALGEALGEAAGAVGAAVGAAVGGALGATAEAVRAAMEGDLGTLEVEMGTGVVAVSDQGVRRYP